MARERRDARTPFKGFDQVDIRKADGTTKRVNDISRFAGNSRARYAQDVVIEVNNTYPAQHIIGALVDGEYVVGTLKGDTIVYSATVVVVEPFDKPVHLKLGTADAPTKYVADFDCSQAKGTIAITADCNTFIEEFVNDEIVATISGTDEGLAGKVSVVLRTSKLGATTYMPSN